MGSLQAGWEIYFGFFCVKRQPNNKNAREKITCLAAISQKKDNHSYAMHFVIAPQYQHNEQRNV